MRYLARLEKGELESVHPLTPTEYHCFIME